MRILQVVTYISPDGAYGGPVRVAINQAKALTDLNHEVVVAAAAGGFEKSLPHEFDGFPVRLFPARKAVPKIGFAGLMSPGLIMHLIRAVRDADVVHVHLARDLVVLPAAALALLLRKRLVVQTHGMIDETNALLARPLDKFLTVPVLKNAHRVLYLTEQERDELRKIAGNGLNLRRVPNGIRIPDHSAIEQNAGPQVLPEILYLARLHPRKRPMSVVNAAAHINGFANGRFVLVGPDEGEGASILQEIGRMSISNKPIWVGPISPSKTLDRMLEASVYVLPSINEPFPMSVLEAMSIGLPVIVTETCGLASLVKKSSAGIVCDASQDSFNAAVVFMLENEEERIKMGSNGRRAMKENFSMEFVAKKLETLYAAGSP